MAEGEDDLLSELGHQTYVDFVSIQPTLQALRSQTQALFAASLSENRRDSTSESAGVASGQQQADSTSGATTESDTPPELPPRDRYRKLMKQHSFNGHDLRCGGGRGTSSRASSQADRKSWSFGDISKSGVAIATHHFVAISKGDINLTKGDTLELIDDSKRWWLVRNIRSGQSGYVPCNHVTCKIPVRHDVWDTTPGELCSRLDDDSRRHHIGRHLVTATKSHNAGNQTELSFVRGDTFLVMNSRSKWWFAQHLASGKEGFIPFDHVTEKAETEIVGKEGGATVCVKKQDKTRCRKEN